MCYRQDQPSKNPLFAPQLHAFISLAKATTSFLTRYQTDAPMQPFIKSDLKDLLEDLLKRFVKKEVCEKGGCQHCDEAAED